MKSILPYLLLFLPIGLFAQTWLYQVDVATSQNGYQDVPLPAQVRALLARDNGNMRLLDAAGTEVPFILNSEALKSEETSIQWMARYEDDYWSHGYSRSYFQNPQQLKLDRIVLKIRNADVHQNFWLSGSDDMNHWYIIKEDYGYDANYDPQSTWNLLTIHFPPTDYKYYKVEIRHAWREPIQIMGAGYYTSASKSGNAQPIPDPQVLQREEGKESIVDIQFDGNHYFDELLFEVDGPELYLRDATLQRKNEAGGYDNVQQFQLSSKLLSVRQLSSMRGKSWRLRIQNRDDKPIRIAGVQARQRKLILTAKLQAHAGYRLMIAAEDMRPAEYDLSYFTADLPKQRPIASIGDVTPFLAPDAMPIDADSANPKLALAQKEVTLEKPIYQQTWFLWAGIGLIVVLVGGMSLALLKDMKKEE